MKMWPKSSCTDRCSSAAKLLSRSVALQSERSASLRLMPDAPWLMAVGYWALDTGILATIYWILDTGYHWMHTIRLVSPLLIDNDWRP